MTDNRRSLSPLTRVYSGLQAILTPDQFDQILPLVNSAVIANTMADEDFARQQQRRYYENPQSMDVDEPFPNAVPLFNPQRRTEIESDADYARRLQEEEYTRKSMHASQPFRPPMHMNKRAPSNVFDTEVGPTASDAEIAAQLQAEEDRRARRHQQRPKSNNAQLSTFSPSQPSQLPGMYQHDAPEIIPIQRPTLRRPTAAHRYANNDGNTNNLSQFLQQMAMSVAAPRPGTRRARGAQQNGSDYGPNDYERLLELDNNVRNNPLTEEQINRLPTERFQGARNATDEENKCSICWEDFEKNQVLRRLLCFHLYHKDCIDKWLKDKNQCPICRAPPIQ